MASLMEIRRKFEVTFGRLFHRPCEPAARRGGRPRPAARRAMEPDPLRRHRHPHRPRRHLVPRRHAFRPARARAAVLHHPAQGSRRVSSRHAGREDAHPRRRRAFRRGAACGERRRNDMQHLVFTTNVGDEIAGRFRTIRFASIPIPRPASRRLTCMCAADSRP